MNYFEDKPCDLSLKFIDLIDQVWKYRDNQVFETILGYEEGLKPVEYDTPSDLYAHEIFDFGKYENVTKEVDKGEAGVKESQEFEQGLTDEQMEQIQELKEQEVLADQSVKSSNTTNEERNSTESPEPSSSGVIPPVGIGMGAGAGVGMGNNNPVPPAEGVQPNPQVDPNPGVGQPGEMIPEGEIPVGDVEPGLGQRIGNFLNENIAAPGIAAVGTFWNERVKPKSQAQAYDKEDHPVVKRIKEEAFANNSDSDEYLVMLANNYLVGNDDFGIKENLTQAAEYYEMAANMGNLEAIVNIGTYYASRNRRKAYKYLKQCIYHDMPE